jgi:hypothetical protein
MIIFEKILLITLLLTMIFALMWVFVTTYDLYYKVTMLSLVGVMFMLIIEIIMV